MTPPLYRQGHLSFPFSDVLLYAPGTVTGTKKLRKDALWKLKSLKDKWSDLFNTMNTEHDLAI